MLTMASSSDSALAADQKDNNYGSLSSHYDVILCGTSLTNSILASALARAGLSVLHCDGADYYGELDAVWTMPYIVKKYQELQAEQEKHDCVEEALSEAQFDEQAKDGVASSTSLRLSPLGATKSLTIKSLDSRIEPECYPFTAGIPVETPYGSGIVQSITYSDMITATSIVIRLDKWNASLYLSIPKSESESDEVKYVARYAFDVHGVLHATCKVARQLLLEHSRAFALDITPGLIFCSGPAVQGLLTSGVSEYLEFKTIQGMLFGKDLQKVPCNKSEVFASKLLKAMDKRRLMWFLQLALDFAVAHESSQEAEIAGEEPAGSDAAVVESLNERHLNQGRALRRPQNKPVANDEMQALERSMESGISFRDYLKEQKLSDSLIELIRYAMALENGLIGENEVSLLDAMQMLGRHLVALGRFGTTAFLATLYGSGELPQAFCRSAAVFGATYMLRTAVETIQWNKDDNNNRTISVTAESRDDLLTHTFTCSNVIVPQQACSHRTYAQRVWRRISVLSGKPIPDGQQRHVIILPPNTIPGHTLAIQGLILDNGVNVAPHAPSSSLLHLTTITPIGETDLESVLESAVKSIVNASSADHSVEEVFQVTFTYDISDPMSFPTHHGIHLVPNDPPNVAVDHAFDQARTVFGSICPGIPFLTVAEKVTNTIQERLGSTAFNMPEDHEQSVLDSAMAMVKP
jgi:RAB protein geranylgeranyltransferase component A